MNAPPPILFSHHVLLLGVANLGYLLLWAGSLALTVTLIVLLLTRWGHSRPLHKCAVLSLIVHLFLAFLTMTVRIVSGDGSGPGPGGDGGGGPPIHVHIVEEASKSAAKSIVAEATAVTEVAAPPLLTPPPKPEVQPPATETAKPEA